MGESEPHPIPDNDAPPAVLDLGFYMGDLIFWGK